MASNVVSLVRPAIEAKILELRAQLNELEAFLKQLDPAVPVPAKEKDPTHSARMKEVWAKRKAATAAPSPAKGRTAKAKKGAS